MLTGPRDIANIITINRKEAKNGLTNVESAIKLLQKLGWRFTSLEDKDSYLTDILFMPAKLEHLQLLARFPSVLFIDCTYNTNKAKLPFLHVVGCTNKNTTFPVVFGLLGGETSDTYRWALRWVNQQLSLGIEGPQVVITVRDLVLMNALRDEIPYAQNLLCIWHINKAVRGWLKGRAYRTVWLLITSTYGMQ